LPFDPETAQEAGSSPALLRTIPVVIRRGLAG
jgi:hypothetical protein